MTSVWQHIVTAMPTACCLNWPVRDETGCLFDYQLGAYNQAFLDQFGSGRKADLPTKLSLWLLKDVVDPSVWLARFSTVPVCQSAHGFSQLLEHKGRWFIVHALHLPTGELVLFFHAASRLKEADTCNKNQLAAYKASLTESRVLAQRIIDHSPAAIITYQVLNDGSSGDDYVVRSVNLACLQVENWQEETVIGQTLGALRPAVDQYGIIEVFQRVWQSGQTSFYPAKAYVEGQKVRWFENTVFRLPAGGIATVYHDVTEKKLAEQALYQEKETFRVTLYSIGDGIVTADRNGTVTLLNQKAEQLIGWTQDDAAGRPLAEVLRIDGNPPFDDFNQARDSGLSFQVHQVRLTDRQGKTVPVSISAAPIKDAREQVTGTVLVLKDLTEELASQKQIDFLRERDALTGLYNRATMERMLSEQATAQAMPLTLIMGDLDGLKLINDAFGYRTGNIALVEIASIIQESCPSTAVIARWGGDDFLCFLPRTRGAVAETLCDQIRKRAQHTRLAQTNLSISLGWSSTDDPGKTWQALLKEAEDTLLKSKLLGSRSYRHTVLESIRKTLEERSLETETHSKRIAWYCRHIGINLKLDTARLDELEVLAMLHDVGKIAIDDRILRKPGPLSEAEMREMRKHPKIGYRIVSTVPELQAIAGAILSHHERWDGTGYPNGLKANRIPLASRILAVADAYDAMTQDRPYRKALSHGWARQELMRHAGTQFDPQVVSTFLAWLRENGPLEPQTQADAELDATQQEG